MESKASYRPMTSSSQNPQNFKQEYQELEAYVLTADKEEFIKNLIQGTDSYYFFTLLNAFLKYGSKIPHDVEELRLAYTKFSTVRAKNIQLRYLLDNLSAATNQDDISRLIKEINSAFLYFNFNHPEPANVKTANFAKPEEKPPEALDPKLVDPEAIVNRILDQNVLPDFQQLNSTALRWINMDKLMTRKLEICQHYFKIVNLSTTPGIMPYLIKYIERYKTEKGPDKEPFDDEFFTRLTYEQLRELLASDSNLMKNKHFAASLFRKEFKITSQKFNVRGSAEKAQKRQQLLQMLKWCQTTLPPLQYDSLQDQLLFEALQLGIELDIFDQELFIEYLKRPKMCHTMVNDDIRVDLFEKKKKLYDSYWHKIHNLSTSTWLSDVALIRLYLERFFITASDVRPFDNFIKVESLNEIFIETKLKLGKVVENVQEALSSERLQAINTEKELRLCRTNKSFFQRDEEVVLTLDFKNIQSLTIKVFEVNTENYYRKYMAPFDPTITLDGFTPSEETVFEFKEAAVVKTTREFKFDLVRKKNRGLFVIEFIGNGLNTRAVIRKGALFTHTRMCNVGTTYMVYDEEYKLCKGDGTGIWLQNKMYTPNEEGFIIIPFVSSATEANAILLHDGHAELTRLSLQSENYQFKCTFLCQNEAFLVGNTAQIIIKPQLTLNGTEAPLSLLREPRVKIVTTNTAGIPQMTIYDKIKFENDKEIAIDYPIIPRPKSIKITVSCKVKPLLEANEKELQDKHEITLDNYENSDKFNQLFLRYTTNGYEVLVLGKNGEGKAGVAVQLTFISLHYAKSIDAKLTTSSEGSCNLGKLIDIEKVKATAEEETHEWRIIQENSLRVPGYVDLLESDVFKLPIQGIRHEFSLIEMIDQIPFGDSTSKLKAEGDNLIIAGLKAGVYHLHIHQLSKVITVMVHEGIYWEGTNIIITKNKRMLNAANPMWDSFIFFKGLSIVGNPGKQDVRLQFELKNRKKTRIHVFLSTFMPDNVNEAAELLSDTKTAPALTKIAQVGRSANTFLNNRDLGDELAYVLERKKQRRFVGNTLERPHLHLKSNFVRDTVTEKGQVTQGTGFEVQNTDAGGVDALGGAGNARNADPGSFGSSIRFNTKLAFLQYPGRLYANLTADEQGLVVINGLDVEHFSTVHIIAMNDYSVVTNTIPLAKESIGMRDMRLQPKSEKEDLCFSFRRYVTSLDTGKQIKFDDYAGTELQIIDSLQRLFEIQEEIQPPGGIRYTLWSFLVEWNKLSFIEKHQRYDKFASHELNLFLYLKDMDYFEMFVKPFIKNKIEKTFIDHFLLRNEEILMKYIHSSKFCLLNTLEQVLLLAFLKEKGRMDDVNAVLDYLKNMNQANHTDTKQYNKIFDTILSSKERKPQPEVSEVVQAREINHRATKSAMLWGGKRHSDKMKLGKKAYAETEDIDFCDDMEMEIDNDEFRFGARKIGFRAGFAESLPSKEYIERQYYENPNARVQPEYIRVNTFWVTLADAIAKGTVDQFISSTFMHATSSHTELLAVLSFMNLPFESGTHKYVPDASGAGLVLEAGASCLVFHKELKECQAAIRKDILMTQRYFDPQDRYQQSAEDPKLQIEKDVSEFLIMKRYGCQAIITNCSVVQQEVQVLLTIPDGAIPLDTGEFTQTHMLIIGSFTTKTIEYYFYFPAPGVFRVTAGSVAVNDAVIAMAKSEKIEVQTERKLIKLERLEDILATGSKADLLHFVKTRNLLNPKVFSFHLIYWLLRSKDFYDEFIAVCRERKFFDLVTWTYSIYHGDLQTFKEVLTHPSVEPSLSGAISYYRSTVATIEAMQISEFFPLINARAHSLNDNKSRLNKELNAQYLRFLKVMVEKPALTSQDNMILCYYLLIQERIDDSARIFSTIKREDLESSGLLQYDYFAAYLDFYTGAPNFKLAREISQKYLDYPVLSWRNPFVEIANQLAEYDQEEALLDESGSNSASLQNAKNSLKEEHLDLEVQGTNLHLTFQNVSSVVMEFYEIDLEILFSRNPFLLKNLEEFSFMKANYVEKIDLGDNSPVLGRSVIKIPTEFHRKNLFILIAGPEKRVSTIYFSSQLNVQLIENYGQLKVNDLEGKPLPMAYVKAFVKYIDGKTSFYKDGYTDMRGRFDFATLNTDEISKIDKFALFVMSDELGSVIKEASGPSSMGRFSDGLQLKSKKWQTAQNTKLHAQEQAYKEMVNKPKLFKEA